MKFGRILERLTVTPESWLSLVSDFSRLFRRAAGRPSSLHHEPEKRERAATATHQRSPRGLPL